jgi:hypothetical protein
MSTLLAKEGKYAQAAELAYHVVHHPLAWQELRSQATELLTELIIDAPRDLMPSPRSLKIVIAELLSQTTT